MPFIEDDLRLVSKNFDVRVFYFNANRFKSKTLHLFALCYYWAKQCLWLLREMPRADAILGWFGDYHLVLPAALRRSMHVPMAVVLAGYDGISLPSLGYGVFFSIWRAPLVRFVYRRANILLPVTNSLIYSRNGYSDFPAVIENGVSHHMPGLRTPSRVIPFGFDPSFWSAGPEIRERVVLTVGIVDTRQKSLRKGLDVLITAAKLLPETKFRVVGATESVEAFLREEFQPPSNVEFVRFIPRNDLPSEYAAASVYAQVSRAEGLPNALCEAMCCGCIPVGSPVFGIPDAIGDAGILLESPDPEHVAAQLMRALDMPAAMRQAARNRILTSFTLEQRRQSLARSIEQMIGG